MTHDSLKAYEAMELLKAFDKFNGTLNEEQREAYLEMMSHLDPKALDKGRMAPAPLVIQSEADDVWGTHFDVEDDDPEEFDGDITYRATIWRVRKSIATPILSNVDKTLRMIEWVTPRNTFIDVPENGQDITDHVLLAERDRALCPQAHPHPLFGDQPWSPRNYHAFSHIQGECAFIVSVQPEAVKIEGYVRPRLLGCQKFISPVASAISDLPTISSEMMGVYYALNHDRPLEVNLHASNVYHSVSGWSTPDDAGVPKDVHGVKHWRDAFDLRDEPVTSLIQIEVEVTPREQNLICWWLDLEQYQLSGMGNHQFVYGENTVTLTVRIWNGELTDRLRFSVQGQGEETVLVNGGFDRLVEFMTTSPGDGKGSWLDRIAVGLETRPRKVEIITSPNYLLW